MTCEEALKVLLASFQKMAHQQLYQGLSLAMVKFGDLLPPLRRVSLNLQSLFH